MDSVPDACDITFEYTKKDILKLKEMWEDIFNDPQEFVEYYFDNVCNNNRILVAYDKDEPVGMVHLNDYIASIYNNRSRCTYIVGVAVKKEYRGRGIMRSMMKKIIDDNKTTDTGLFFLMPEEPAYYQGLGFEKIYDTVVIEGNIMYQDETEEELYKDFDSARLGISNLSDYDDDGLSRLAYTINHYLSKDYEVYSKRDVEYLKKMLMEHMCQNGNVCVIKDDNQNISGLFSYEIYDGVLYAERVEILGGSALEIFNCVVRLCIDNACVGCVVTMPQSKLGMDIPVIKGMDIQVKDGHGIMAFVPKQRSHLVVDEIKDKSFFDEIV